MKIGMILDRSFPPDIRVEKEAKSLINAGHEVHLLSLSDLKKDEIETVDGLKITRCRFVPQNRLLRKMNFLWYQASFMNLKLMIEIEKFVRANNIQVLHVHDLPMVLSVVSVSKRMGIPVIADLHENYPAFVQLTLSKAGPIDRLMNNVRRWKRYEKKCLKWVEHILVVVEEAKERITKEYGISDEKVSVISNTEDISSFERIPLKKQVIYQYIGQFVILYVGGIAPHRGLDVAICAMPHIKTHIPNAKLLIVGNMGDCTTQLINMAKSLKVEDDVIFVGWQPFDLVPSYIVVSDICIVPHHANEHTDSTVPHKLFQYMLMRKPVIVSSCKPLSRIIQITRAGLVFEAGNSLDFARTCFCLVDPKKRVWYGENGRRAVEKQYNWERTIEELQKVYNALETTKVK